MAKKKAARKVKKAQEKTVLILRTCTADMESHGGFKWPKSGRVECPDWDPNPERACGGALHGLPWGEGDGGLLNWGDDARWLVVKANEKDVLPPSGGKVRFRRCNVVYCGDSEGAVAYLAKHDPLHEHRATVLKKATAGDSGQATAGYRGQATAGYSGQATAGYSGQATAGDSGQATAGDSGQATAGDSGQATAGYSGQATAGDSGQATAGYRGQATAGYRGLFIISYWDYSADRRRVKVAYVGENGIKAGTTYRLDDSHELQKV